MCVMPALATAVGTSVRTELDQLQGVWTSVAGPREARLLVAGRRFTFEFTDGELYMGTLAVTSVGMDLTIEEGPAKFVGLVTKCLYSLDGGVLRWCPGRPGSDRRPAAFPSVDDPKYLSLVFRKASRRS
jgi:hypothetical protein